MMQLGGALAMLAALALLMAMVVGVLEPGLGLSFLSYALLFLGVFLFAAGVIRRR